MTTVAISVIGKVFAHRNSVTGVCYYMDLYTTYLVRGITTNKQ